MDEIPLPGDIPLSAAPISVQKSEHDTQLFQNDKHSVEVENNGVAVFRVEKEDSVAGEHDVASHPAEVMTLQLNGTGNVGYLGTETQTSTMNNDAKVASDITQYSSTAENGVGSEITTKTGDLALEENFQSLSGQMSLEPHPPDLTQPPPGAQPPLPPFPPPDVDYEHECATFPPPLLQHFSPMPGVSSVANPPYHNYSSYYNHMPNQYVPPMYNPRYMAQPPLPGVYMPPISGNYPYHDDYPNVQQAQSFDPVALNPPLPPEPPALIEEQRKQVETAQETTAVDTVADVKERRLVPEQETGREKSAISEDGNRYSPSLPMEEEESTQDSTDKSETAKQKQTQSVLGKVQAKKRLLAFSFSKGISQASNTKKVISSGNPLSEKKESSSIMQRSDFAEINIQAEDGKLDGVNDFNGDQSAKKKLKKPPKVEKARETIEEIEEIKRVEAMMGTVPELYKVSRLTQPLIASDPSMRKAQSGSIADQIMSDKNTPMETARRTTSAEKKRSRRSRSRSKSKRKSRSRSHSKKSKHKHRSHRRSYTRSRSKSAEKEKEKKPKVKASDIRSWGDFKKANLQLDRYRRLKYQESGDFLTSERDKWKKEGRSYRRRSRSRERKSISIEKEQVETSRRSRMNILNIPTEIRKSVTAVRGDELVEYPSYIIRYTETRPILKYSENPKHATMHLISRTELYETIPEDIIPILDNFFESIRPKRLKDEEMMERKSCRLAKKPVSIRKNKGREDSDEENDEEFDGWWPKVPFQPSELCANDNEPESNFPVSYSMEDISSAASGLNLRVEKKPNHKRSRFDSKSDEKQPPVSIVVRSKWDSDYEESPSHEVLSGLEPEPVIRQDYEEETRSKSVSPNYEIENTEFVLEKDTEIMRPVEMTSLQCDESPVVEKENVKSARKLKRRFDVQKIDNDESAKQSNKETEIKPDETSCPAMSVDREDDSEQNQEGGEDKIASEYELFLKMVSADPQKEESATPGKKRKSEKRKKSESKSKTEELREEPKDRDKKKSRRESKHSESTEKCTHEDITDEPQLRYSQRKSPTTEEVMASLENDAKTSDTDKKRRKKKKERSKKSPRLATYAERMMSSERSPSVELAEDAISHENLTRLGPKSPPPLRLRSKSPEPSMPVELQFAPLSPPRRSRSLELERPKSVEQLQSPVPAGIMASPEQVPRVMKKMKRSKRSESLRRSKSYESPKHLEVQEVRYRKSSKHLPTPPPPPPEYEEEGKKSSKKDKKKSKSEKKRESMEVVESKVEKKRKRNKSPSPPANVIEEDEEVPIKRKKKGNKEKSKDKKKSKHNKRIDKKKKIKKKQKKKRYETSETSSESDSDVSTTTTSSTVSTSSTTSSTTISTSASSDESSSSSDTYKKKKKKKMKSHKKKSKKGSKKRKSKKITKKKRKHSSSDTSDVDTKSKKLKKTKDKKKHRKGRESEDTSDVPVLTHKSKDKDKKSKKKDKTKKLKSAFSDDENRTMDVESDLEHAKKGKEKRKKRERSSSTESNSRHKKSKKGDEQKSKNKKSKGKKEDKFEDDFFVQSLNDWENSLTPEYVENSMRDSELKNYSDTEISGKAKSPIEDIDEDTTSSVASDAKPDFDTTEQNTDIHEQPHDIPDETAIMESPEYGRQILDDKYSPRSTDSETFDKGYSSSPAQRAEPTMQPSLFQFVTAPVPVPAPYPVPAPAVSKPLFPVVTDSIVFSRPSFDVYQPQPEINETVGEAPIFSNTSTISTSVKAISAECDDKVDHRASSDCYIEATSDQVEIQSTIQESVDSVYETVSETSVHSKTVDDKLVENIAPITRDEHEGSGKPSEDDKNISKHRRSRSVERHRRSSRSSEERKRKTHRYRRSHSRERHRRRSISRERRHRRSHSRDRHRRRSSSKEKYRKRSSSRGKHHRRSTSKERHHKRSTSKERHHRHEKKHSKPDRHDHERDTDRKKRSPLSVIRDKEGSELQEQTRGVPEMSADSLKSNNAESVSADNLPQQGNKVSQIEESDKFEIPNSIDGDSLRSESTQSFAQSTKTTEQGQSAELQKSEGIKEHVEQLSAKDDQTNVLQSVLSVVEKIKQMPIKGNESSSKEKDPRVANACNVLNLDPDDLQKIISFCDVIKGVMPSEPKEKKDEALSQENKAGTVPDTTHIQTSEVALSTVSKIPSIPGITVTPALSEQMRLQSLAKESVLSTISINPGSIVSPVSKAAATVHGASKIMKLPLPPGMSATELKWLAKEKLKEEKALQKLMKYRMRQQVDQASPHSAASNSSSKKTSSILVSPGFKEKPLSPAVGDNSSTDSKKSVSFAEDGATSEQQARIKTPTVQPGQKTKRKIRVRIVRADENDEDTPPPPPGSPPSAVFIDPRVNPQIAYSRS